MATTMNSRQLELSASTPRSTATTATLKAVINNVDVPANEQATFLLETDNITIAPAAIVLASTVTNFTNVTTDGLRLLKYFHL